MGPPSQTVVIIPAAGQGKRMGAAHNKLLLPLGDKTILAHTLNCFQKHPQIRHIYLVIAQQDRNMLEPVIREFIDSVTLVEGGVERQDSVYNALQIIQSQSPIPDWILVHDGARPFCSASLINRVLKKCQEGQAVIPVLPVRDTIRRMIAGKAEVLNRAELFATQTPQGFPTRLLIDANQQARQGHWQVTDDASLLERMGIPIVSVEGEEVNLKITTPLDLRWAQWLLLNH